MNIQKYNSTPQYQEWRIKYYKLKKLIASLEPQDIRRWEAELELEEVKRLMHI